MYESDRIKDFNSKKAEARQLRKQINDDPELTPGAKKERIKMLDQELTRQSREHSRAVLEERKDGVRKQTQFLFKPEATELESNYRDAVRHADSLGARKLEREYSRADQRGDETLKKAIASRAFSEGANNIVSRWANEDESRQKKFESLKQRQEAANDTFDIQRQFSTYL